MSGTEARIDAGRTCLQKVFFQMFKFDTGADLIAATRDMRFGIDTLARSVDVREEVYSGWVYWLVFLKGVIDYREAGELREDNVYLDYLTRFYLPRQHDPGLTAELDAPALVLDRVHRRLALADQIAALGDASSRPFPPVSVIVDDAPPQFPLRVYVAGSEHPIAATLVDGWHRLFVARLWEVPTVAGVIVHRPAEVGLVPVAAA